MSRIAFVGTELCSVTSPTGGLERLVQGWATVLGAHHDVVLVDMRPEADTPREIDGIPVVAVETVAELAGTLRRIGAEVVQTNNRCLWETGSALRVNTFHNYPQGWSTTASDGDLHRLKEAVSGQITTTVSRSLATQVESMFALEEGRVRVTYPFVAQEFLDEPWRGGSGILFPSRLLMKKGPDQVLEAARLLGLEDRVTFLDFVTPFLRESDEYLGIRQRINSSRSTLSGQVARATELAALYADADLVVAVATEPEGMGLVALEAQGVGTPIVSAGPGGLREATVDPNEHLDRFDPEALAAGIERALNAGGGGQTKGAIAERFSLSASAAGLEAAFASS